MEKTQCPICNTTNDTNICDYCGEDSSRFSATEVSSLRLKRQLRLAVIGRRYDAIITICEMLEMIDPNNVASQYFSVYAKKEQGNKQPYNDFFKNYDGKNAASFIYHFIQQEDDYHLIINTIEKADISIEEKKHILLALQNDQTDEQTLVNRLFPSITLSPWIKKDVRITNAIILSIFGFLLLVIFHLFMFSLKDEVLYFSYVLGFLIPNVLLAMGIRRFIFTSNKSWFVLLTTIILMVITIYIATVFREANPIVYFQKLITSPYDFFKEILRRTIENT